MKKNTYFVRGPAAAFLTVGRDGPRFPYWTCQKPRPLPLQQAEMVRQAALRIGCGSVYLERAEE